ncbi:acyl-CoA synthetase (AMP-forming)/AMP-acid ligase II [Mycolicibacterium chubuense NBB4]|uniref:Acyl-CoA synthetase (AMP-forming)/AMP-acid ligase II n=1 Tax=Mycolicibacterium chubuense (strain NBB4) TaxID=710421 RepID=I4BPW1_MYCCN|nr:AMP-binding protein [Mycolicibacterium chubuense]AFM19318.1 acyl-CoA synthetase (AMP-forming)/AMP-acid ligase II [Mycolicibacterium chubuense NBB4]
MSGIAFPDTTTTIPAADVGDDVVADFAAAADRWPDRPALVHNGAVVTYGELMNRVRLLASRYRAHRSGDETRPDLIGALVSHAPGVVAHLFGILQAGATYCPVDAALPEARRESIADVLGLDRLFATTAPSQHSTNLRIDTFDPSGGGLCAEVLQPPWDPSYPAYVLCTSGSTGTPKPVMVSRHALTVTVRALRELFALTPHDRVLQFASLGWDTCLEEILPALTAGSALVFDDAAHSGSFAPFLRMLAEREITVVDLPTAFWHELVLFLHEEKAALPESIRLVVIGGERVDLTRLRQWRNLELGHVGLLNTYGCTETTMITHAIQLCGPGTGPGIATSDTTAPIGRPLPHVRDHITDDGELLVSGPGLATGYLGMPEKTASAFPVIDYGTGPERWFRTGDIATRDERGLLYSQGRADEQVKVLGVRVHPAEVEMQLITHPAVTGAVVVGEHRLGRTSLTAYVVASEATTAAEVKSHLRERLPNQFVPTRVNFVASLAYTASGKVDRAATRRAASENNNKGAGR